MNDDPEVSELSDAALMRMMQHGDRMGHTILYGRYQARAMNVAVVLCGDANVASGAVSQAFNNVWEQRAEYEPQSGTVHNWLFNIVRVATKAAMSTSGGESPSDRERDIANSTRPISEQPPDGRDVANFFGEQLSRLPREEREVVALAYFGELDHRQIAAMLSLEPTEVEGRMRMGLERLRRIVNV